ncbi:MAG: hypothetical protein GXP16_03035 [Gammaproteobacteria bacterium]|nr:hypothetical protein [Gammaproteobacteria bacterium]
MFIAPRLATFALIGCFLFSTANSSLAQTDFNWDVNGDGTWRTDGNWDETGFPNDALHNVHLFNATNSTDGVVVTLGSSTTTDVGDLLIDNSGSVGDQNTLSISNNANLDIHGDITNNGIISLNSGGNSTKIRLDGSDLTLSGSGVINLGAQPANGIVNVLGTNTLINTADHTLAGGGGIGSNTIGIDNEGTINANLTSTTMTLDPSVALGLTNTGTLQATQGGILLLTGIGGGSFGNTGGMIEANGANSEVRLTTNASISNGTVRSVNGGLVRLNASQNAFFTDVTFEGSIQSDNNSDFGISGTIANMGTLTLTSTGNVTDLEVQAAGAILTGGGKVVLSATAGNNAGINGISNASLTNSATHTIEGQGTFGKNTIGIINQGTVNANVSGQLLTLDPDAVNHLTNSGTLRASQGGTMILTGSGGGSFTNTGKFEALDGSSLNMITSAILTNLNSGTLDGGAYRAVETGNGATLSLLGTAVDTTTAGTTTELSGNTAAMTFGGTDLQDSLVNNGGLLRALDGYSFVMTNMLNNTGRVELGGAGLAAAALTSTGDITNAAGAEIFGHGVINNTILQ